MSTDVDELQRFCEYEIAASVWAAKMSRGWMQRLAARYFVRKTRRKYARYLWRKQTGIELREMNVGRG
jgi:hypothetical protein